MPQPFVKRNFVLIMLLPILLLSACATQSTPSVVDCPRIPLKPVAQHPTPPLPYSASARLDMERWQKRLTATQAMQQSSPTPGPSN